MAPTALTVRTCTRALDVPMADWDELTALPPASITGSRAWFEAALATVDRGVTPHVLAVNDGRRHVGLLPLVVDDASARPTLRFAGSPFNDLSDLVVRPESAASVGPPVIEALRELSAGGLALELDDVDPDGVLARADPARRLLKWEPGTCAPVIDLRDPTARPSRRHLRRLERAAERLRASHSVEFRRCDGEDAIAALDDFIRLRASRLRALRRNLSDPPLTLLAATVTALAPLGRAAFMEMLVDGSAVARDLYLLEDRVAMLWLRALDMGWLSFSCGHLLLQASADSFRADGYDALDLGRGGEEYKFRWGARPRVLLRARGSVER